VLLNPTDSQGGEIDCPFIYPLNAMEVLTERWADLGAMHMVSLNELYNVQGSSSPITITVFAHLENYQLIGPTSQTQTTVFPQGNCCTVDDEESVELCGSSDCSVCLDPQGDEYGVVSGPAHTIANWSGKLSAAPWIGKYARATSMISETVGNVAALFGFSRARALQLEPMFTRFMPNFTNTNAQDLSRSLSVDQKKEITIDPRVVGAEPIDHMALVPLACKESLVATFDWRSVDSVDTLLFQQLVTPVQGSVTTSSPPQKVSVTPSAWVSLPFTYWTGSMEVRFQVVASKYHRGRLRSLGSKSFSSGRSSV